MADNTNLHSEPNNKIDENQQTNHEINSRIAATPLGENDNVMNTYTNLSLDRTIGIIGLMIAIIGLVIAINPEITDFIFHKKRINIKLISQTVSLPRNGIEMLYNGSKIPNYEIIQLIISNPGWDPIRSDDYDQYNPLGIELKNINKILWSNQINDNSNIKVKTEIGDDKITFNNVLIDKNDSYKIEIGLVPEPGKKLAIKPIGRIAGIREIELDELSSESNNKQDDLNVLYKNLLAAVAVVIMSLVTRNGKKPYG